EQKSGAAAKPHSLARDSSFGKNARPKHSAKHLARGGDRGRGGELDPGSARERPRRRTFGFDITRIACRPSTSRNSEMVTIAKDRECWVRRRRKREVLARSHRC